MVIASPDFELKDTNLPLVALVLRHGDVDLLARQLERRLGETPNFFDDDPVIIDIGALRQSPDVPDFPALVRLLVEHRMKPVAVAGGSPEQLAAARDAGLPEAPLPAPVPRPKTIEVVKEVVREVVRDVVREVPYPVASLVIDRPLRSGQQVYAKGCDLIVLAAVNVGAEVLADGHVHVYGPLRGKAIAGASGNTDARILTTCLEPELIAIAGTYRTTELPIPADVAGKPAMIRLVGDKLVMEPIKS